VSRLRRGLAVGVAVAALTGSTVPVAGASTTPDDEAGSGSGAADLERVACEIGVTQYVTQRSLSNALPMISTPQSWELATGRGVTVAVVDSGVNVDNQHFGPQAVLPGASLLPGDGRTDDQGHGTAVAGVIAARPIPQSVLRGQAYDATILPVRVYDYGEDDSTTVPPQLPLSAASVAQGIRLAADAGADVINVSLSSGPEAPGLRQQQIAVRYAQRKGALIVAAAGDSVDGSEVRMERYPASFDGVIGVGAANATGAVDDFSIHHSGVDVIAPGQNVLVPFHADGDCLGGEEAPQTSYAAGFVSGLAAQLMERFPDESTDLIAWRILATARRDRPSARDDESGWGLIQPFAALSVVPDGNRPGPPLPGAETQQVAQEQTRLEVVSSRTDPLAAVRRETVWWAIGALGLAGLGLVLRPLVRRRR